MCMFEFGVAERSCDRCEMDFASVHLWTVEVHVCAGGWRVGVGRGVGRNARTLLILLLAHFFHNLFTAICKKWHICTTKRPIFSHAAGLKYSLKTCFYMSLMALTEAQAASKLCRRTVFF